MFQTINWKKIELTNPVTYKEDGIYYQVKTLINNKGTVMAEIIHKGQKMAMREFDKLPINAQQSIKACMAATA